MRYLDEMTTTDLTMVEHEMVQYFIHTKRDKIDPEIVELHAEIVNELWNREPEIMEAFTASGEYASLYEYITTAPEIIYC